MMVLDFRVSLNTQLTLSQASMKILLVWSILLFPAASEAAPQYYDPYYNQPYNSQLYPMGFNFEPAQVMNEAQNAAKTTRAVADLIDSRGHDFLSMVQQFSSQSDSKGTKN